MQPQRQQPEQAKQPRQQRHCPETVAAASPGLPRHPTHVISRTPRRRFARAAGYGAASAKSRRFGRWGSSQARGRAIDSAQAMAAWHALTERVERAHALHSSLGACQLRTITTHPPRERHQHHRPVVVSRPNRRMSPPIPHPRPASPDARSPIPLLPLATRLHCRRSVPASF